MGMFSALLIIVACAAGPEQATPSEQAAEPSRAEVWLDKIEAKAAEVSALSAKLTYVREQNLLGGKQTRYGTLVYQAGPPAKFRANFDKLAESGVLHEMNVTFIFDGRYLVERDNDERIWTRRELAREGESVDLLAFGQGPFSLPLNMKKAEVLDRFTVEAADGGEDQPVHLVLTPREDQDMDVTKVELWFERDTLLPIRARQEEETDAMDMKLRETAVNPPSLEEAFAGLGFTFSLSRRAVMNR